MVRSVWSGALSDLGLGGASLTYSRWTAVHFAAPTHALEYAWAGSMPRPIDPVNNVVKASDGQLQKVFKKILLDVLFVGL